MRTVSLLPAATEIVAALGLIDELVGVSHECDFSPAAAAKPRVTGCDLHRRDVASHEIDRWVSEKLSRGEDLFTVDEELLRALRPELILTQKLCDVCAPAYGSIAALAATLPGPPRVLNLEPSSLADILDNIRVVAEAMGVPETGTRVVGELRARVETVRQSVAETTTRPCVAVIEWLDPVFCSGHWTPELVEIAGGEEVLGRKWADSVRRSWDDVARANPEILVIACCGQTRERALQDWDRIKSEPPVRDLFPVKSGRVFATDGNAYFSRPSPRVIDTLEILAGIIQNRSRCFQCP